MSVHTFLLQPHVLELAAASNGLQLCRSSFGEMTTESCLAVSLLHHEESAGERQSSDLGSAGPGPLSGALDPQICADLEGQ